MQSRCELRLRLVHSEFFMLRKTNVVYLCVVRGWIQTREDKLFSFISAARKSSTKSKSHTHTHTQNLGHSKTKLLLIPLSFLASTVPTYPLFPQPADLSLLHLSPVEPTVPQSSLQRATRGLIICVMFMENLHTSGRTY